jgi:hypothetical protein
MKIPPYLCLLLCLVPFRAAPQPVLSLSSASGSPGGTVAMDLQLAGALEPYGGFNATVELPPGFQFLGLLTNGLLSGAGFIIDQQNSVSPGTNELSILAYSPSNSFTGPGVLLSILLQIATTAPLGSSPVVFKQNTNSILSPHALSSIGGTSSVPHTVSDGMVQVTQVLTHPADTNEGFRIDSEELTAYAAAWKLGKVWPIGPNPIPADYVTWAGYLWKTGECYAYFPSNSPPYCWVPAPCPSPGLVAGREGGKAPPDSPMELLKEVRDSFVTRASSNGVVFLQASPGPKVAAYAVEEALPAGLAPEVITSGGYWDPVNRKIKWGLFFDNTPRMLSYRLGRIADLSLLSGVGSFDGHSVPVAAVMSVNLESGLRILRMSANAAGGGLDMTFSTMIGRTYYLEYTSSLSSNIWHLAAGPLAGTGQPITWRDEGVTSGLGAGQSGTCYYRVRSAP